MSVTDSSIQLALKYERLDPDVRLMLQVKANNAEAFEQLVSKYQTRLIAVLDHLLPVRGQAEDLAQEVFLRVYRARERYVPKARFSTWLFTITNNVAHNAVRKLSRKKEINLTPNASMSGLMSTKPLENMAKEKSALMPARQIASSEAAGIVRDAIQTLNERQKMALLLSKFEDMSYLEIAAAMDTSTQAVKSLLSRARANLREVLEPYVKSGVVASGIERAGSSDDEHTSK